MSTFKDTACPVVPFDYTEMATVAWQSVDPIHRCRYGFLFLGAPTKHMATNLIVICAWRVYAGGVSGDGTTGTGIGQ